MGQEKRTWDTERERERKRLYRERKKAELEDPSLPVVDLNAEPDPKPVLSSLPPGMPSLERYVSDALLAAEIHFSQTSPNARDSTKDLAGTLERAESYARWRYAGVLSGEVNGL